MNFISLNKLIKISLIILVMCYAFLTVSAQNIILESSNNFVDTIEPDVTIYKTGENSPIFGGNLEFSCGECGFADFDDAISKIGGGGNSICSYSGGVPIKIVNNDDQLCARSTISDRKYDLDFLTWVAHGKCTDIDNGSSCSTAENQFSYVRSEKFILNQLDIEVGSKTDKNLQDEPHNYKISKDAKPGDKIEIIVEIENGFSDDIEIETYMEVIIKDIDGGDDLEEDTSKEYIKSGKDERFKVELTIPDRVDDDLYDVIILIEGEDENNGEYKIEKTFRLEIDKDKHDIQITKADLKSNNCQKDTNLEIEIINYGWEDEEVMIVVANTQIGLELEETDIELETGTDDDAEYTLNLPLILENLDEGTYPITIDVYRDEDKLEDTKTVNLMIEDCGGTEKLLVNRIQNDLINESLKIQKHSDGKNMQDITSTAKEKSWFDENFNLILLILIILSAIIFLIILYLFILKK